MHEILYYNRKDNNKFLTLYTKRICICKKWLPFENILGVRHFSVVLQNVDFIKDLFSIVLYKSLVLYIKCLLSMKNCICISYVFFCICICSCFSLKQKINYKKNFREFKEKGSDYVA